MLRIPCPWCGERDESEFVYAGDATARRPADDAPEDAFFDFVHRRANPKGWHAELWRHALGCRRHFKVVRHTVSHEIAASGWPQDELPIPGGEGEDRER